jgi:hypothetical protein
LIGLAEGINGVRQAERAGFLLSSWHQRDPGRDQPAGRTPLVDDCLIIVQKASTDKRRLKTRDVSS